MYTSTTIILLAFVVATHANAPVVKASTKDAAGAETPRLILESDKLDGNVYYIYIDRNRPENFAKIEVQCKVADDVDASRRTQISEALKWKPKEKAGFASGSSRIVTGRSKLIINNPQPTDPVQYDCVYESESLTLSTTLHVIYNDDPTISHIPLADFQEDHEIKLKCGEVALTETDSFEWSVDGEPLLEHDASGADTDVEMEQDGEDRGRLKRRGSDDSKAGMYRCAVTTATNNVRNHLTRVTSIPVVRTSSRSMNVMEGEAFYVDCLANGSPKPKDVQWKRKADNENAFTPSMPKNVKFTVSSANLVNGRLYINHVTQDDRAEYECTAKNEYGVSNGGHVMIRVKDKFAALWPFLAILAEVLILVIIIFIFERRQAARRRREEADDAMDAKKRLTNESHR